MTLHEAIKSGKPFRRAAWKGYMVAVPNGLEEATGPKGRPYSLEDILADDWEIQEPCRAIVRSELIAKAVRLLDDWKGRYECWSYESYAIELARRLGLGD